MRKQRGQTDTFEEQKLLKNNLPRKIKSHRHVIFLGPVLLFLEIQSPLPPPTTKKKTSWERKCCHMTMLASPGFTQHHIRNSGTVTTKGSLLTCLCHNTWSITSRNCTLLTFWFPDSRMGYVLGKYLLRAYYVTRTEWGIRTHNCIIHTLVYLISHNFYKNKKVI